MSVKIFTNIFKGNATDSVAINPAHVVSVWEAIKVTEANEVSTVTSLFTVTGQTFQLEETYLEVVARLNEE
jgi:hypothetical protein